MTITIPSRVADQARWRLRRAQEVLDSLSAVYDIAASLFTRVPPARDDEALAIRRAWLRASA